MTAGWREWGAAEASECLARPGADDDKYARGVLGVITGSLEYPGAAVLGVEAAHRVGVGMVRYLGPRAVRDAVLARRPETVTVSGRVQAWLLGSGMDPAHRSVQLAADLQRAVASALPLVVDAGALDLVAARAAPTVLTPHARELATLLSARGADVDTDAVRGDPAGWARRAAEMLDVVVLLKGSTTFVCGPVGAGFTVRADTHWLASAGTGDVLGGVLGGLLATSDSRLSEIARADDADGLASAGGDAVGDAVVRIAATAAYVHAQAARRASTAVSGGPITALDVAEHLPSVVGELLG